MDSAGAKGGVIVERILGRILYFMGMGASAASDSSGIASFIDLWHPQPYNKHPQSFSRARVPVRRLSFADVPGLGDIGPCWVCFDESAGHITRYQIVHDHLTHPQFFHNYL